MTTAMLTNESRVEAQGPAVVGRSPSRPIRAARAPRRYIYCLVDCDAPGRLWPHGHRGELGSLCRCPRRHRCRRQRHVGGETRNLARQRPGTSAGDGSGHAARPHRPAREVQHDRRGQGQEIGRTEDRRPRAGRQEEGDPSACCRPCGPSWSLASRACGRTWRRCSGTSSRQPGDPIAPQEAAGNRRPRGDRQAPGKHDRPDKAGRVGQEGLGSQEVRHGGRPAGRG